MGLMLAFFVLYSCRVHTVPIRLRTRCLGVFLGHAGAFSHPSVLREGHAADSMELFCSFLRSALELVQWKAEGVACTQCFVWRVCCIAEQGGWPLAMAEENYLPDLIGS